MATYTAHFTPEAWVNDYAIEIDAEGPQEWDCTTFAQEHPSYVWRLAAWGDLAEGVTDTWDMFRGDPAAPAWIHDWRGPFTIRIRTEPADNCEGQDDSDESEA